jgi:hypothetical protein
MTSIDTGTVAGPAQKARAHSGSYSFKACRGSSPLT